MATAVMSESTFSQIDTTHEDDFRDTRVYLECPYHEKELVKELGARWDNTQRLWFAPAGTNLGPFAKWLP